MGSTNLKQIIGYALALEEDRKSLLLAIPHILVGNRLLSKFVVRELACKLASSEEDRNRILNLKHPNFQEVDIWPGAKITQARDIASNFRKLGQHNLVVSILGFENFAFRSQDVLLKTFEDQSDWRLYIAISRLDKIAPTIISRCHRWWVPGLSIDDKITLLAWSGQGNKDRVDKALDLARGNVDRVYSWLRDADASQLVDMWREGPSKLLPILLNQSTRLSDAALDVLYAAMKRFLLWANYKALSGLRMLPEKFQAGIMLRHYLIDKYLILHSEGAFGKIYLDGS